MRPPRLLRTVYLRAIEVLKERGWYQGGLEEGPGGPCCMVGACNVALSGSATSPRFHQDLDEVARAVGSILLGDWNDAKGRTRRQVIAALRKAAKLAGNRRVAS